MRVGLIQLNSSDLPEENLPVITAGIAEAASAGADIALTPEVSNCVSVSRRHQIEVLCFEEDDPTLAGIQEAAQAHKIWVLAGSLGLQTRDRDGRFANRSLLVSPDGQVTARYDKIHMFDVQVTESETFRESDGYRPGEAAVVGYTPMARIGMSICYDVRFPHLYRALAQAGADVITVPAAFSPVTGAAHWEVLLRARAIETGCFIVAPAQCGKHKGRSTHGHSMVVAPWGEVLLDMGDAPGVACVDLDLDVIRQARHRVPSLSHDRPFTAPIMPGDE